MAKIFTTRFVTYFFLILSIFLLATVFYKTSTKIDENLNLKLDEKSIMLIELDLQSFLIYNNPSISLIEDYKNLLGSKYTHSVYSLHRFNLVSSSLLLIIPFMLLVFVFLMLGVSLRMTVLVSIFFFLFSIIPLFIF